jgi:hypothetical protein
MFKDYAFVMCDWAPFIKYNRNEELTGCLVDQAVCLLVWSVPEECAYERLCTKLVAVVVRYVYECTGTENTERWYVQLGATPGFFQCFVCESAGRGDVAEEGGVFKGVEPVGVREIGIREDHPDFVKEGPVHEFGHPILLWCAWHGDLMFDAFGLQELLDLVPDVFTPSKWRIWTLFPVSSSARAANALRWHMSSDFSRMPTTKTFA